MDLKSAMGVSVSGLRAQSLRMRVIAENLANADSVATEPGGQPYARKTVQFRAKVDKGTGAEAVKVQAIREDKTGFRRVYDPRNPVADATGYVQLPNVSSLIETADLKAAQRSYEANLNAIEAAKQMTMRTLDLLK